MIANHVEARERELPLVQEVDVKVKELHQTIASLNNHQASLRNTLRKLKEKNGEMDEKVRLLTARPFDICVTLGIETITTSILSWLGFGNLCNLFV